MDNKAKANSAEQTRSVDDSKRVTVAKTVAASQGDTAKWIPSESDENSPKIIVA